MASARELRRRIKSVKNTSQITKAMQMVAATKMRRAQTQAVGGRPYSGNLMESLSRLLPRIEVEAHPLLSGNGSSISGVVVLTTDKGLVGALNTNIFRSIHDVGRHSGERSDSRIDPGQARLPDGQARMTENVFYTVGRKGRSFIARTGKDLKADFENSDVVTFRQAKQLAKLIMADFLAREIGEAYIVYPEFVSTLRQEAKRVKLLPISISDIEYRVSENQNDKRLTINDKQANEFLIEPNPDELLDELLTHFVEVRIYQALLETKASEHSSRMVAMKNATDNAKELVEDLTLTYNQTRQDAITKEILEIATASIAMS